MNINQNLTQLQEPVVDNIAELEQKALNAILRAVPFDGWRDAAFRSAARDLPDGALLAVFPGGIQDAFDLWHKQLNTAMLDAYASQSPAPQKIRDKVHTLVMARLHAASPHKEAVRAATAYYALPTRWLAAQRYLWDIADSIWRTAGDTSTDYNYYTKRGLLAEVYRATALYWLQDDSDTHHNTAAFCARRISDVLTVGKNLGKVRSAVDAGGDLVSKGLNTLGRYVA